LLKRVLSLSMIFLILVPTQAFASVIITEPYYDSSRNEYVYVYDTTQVAYIVYRFYSAGDDPTIDAPNTEGEWDVTNGTGAFFITCNGTYQYEFLDYNRNVLETAEYVTTDIVNPPCQSYAPDEIKQIDSTIEEGQVGDKLYWFDNSSLDTLLNENGHFTVSQSNLNGQCQGTRLWDNSFVDTWKEDQTQDQPFFITENGNYKLNVYNDQNILTHKDDFTITDLVDDNGEFGFQSYGAEPNNLSDTEGCTNTGMGDTGDTGSGDTGTGDTGGTTCDICEKLSTISGKLSDIPSPPYWDSIKGTMESIDSKIMTVSDLENMLGPPAPKPEPPPQPEATPEKAPIVPDLSTDEQDFNADTEQLEKATFDYSDIQNEAEEIPFREDTTGGFDFTNPLDNVSEMPDQPPTPDQSYDGNMTDQQQDYNIEKPESPDQMQINTESPTPNGTIGDSPSTDSELNAPSPIQTEIGTKKYYKQELGGG